MRDWIIPGILYLLFLAFFRILGGFRSAADAMRRWGEARSGLRTNAGSSS